MPPLPRKVVETKLGSLAWSSSHVSATLRRRKGIHSANYRIQLGGWQAHAVMSLQCLQRQVHTFSASVCTEKEKTGQSRRRQTEAVGGGTSNARNHWTNVRCGEDGPSWSPRRPAGTSSSCAGDTFDVLRAGGMPFGVKYIPVYPCTIALEKSMRAGALPSWNSGWKHGLYLRSRRRPAVRLTAEKGNGTCRSFNTKRPQLPGHKLASFIASLTGIGANARSTHPAAIRLRMPAAAFWSPLVATISDGAIGV